VKANSHIYKGKGATLVPVPLQSSTKKNQKILLRIRRVLCKADDTLQEGYPTWCKQHRLDSHNQAYNFRIHWRRPLKEESLTVGHWDWMEIDQLMLQGFMYRWISILTHAADQVNFITSTFHRLVIRRLSLPAKNLHLLIGAVTS
jgi:hypothetical protein